MRMYVRYLLRKRALHLILPDGGGMIHTHISHARMTTEEKTFSFCFLFCVTDMFGGLNGQHLQPQGMQAQNPNAASLWLVKPPAAHAPHASDPFSFSQHFCVQNTTGELRLHGRHTAHRQTQWKASNSRIRCQEFWTDQGLTCNAEAKQRISFLSRHARDQMHTFTRPRWLINAE